MTGKICEAGFSRWGWRRSVDAHGLDIARREVCALGGINEYLRVLILADAQFPQW